MFSDTKSLTQNTCAQIFTTDFNWVAFYPMKKKSDVPDALELLISDHGAFNNIIPDNAPELASGNFKHTANKFGIHIHPVEAWMPSQNKAEACIRELKQSFRRAMRKTNTPAILWDHCFQLMAEIHTHTALDLFPLQENSPFTYLTGETPDISHLVEFS